MLKLELLPDIIINESFVDKVDFIQAHLQVYNNPELARTFLLPMANHLEDGCIGNISEIFDGDTPFLSRGCFAQAWSVAEVLRSWLMVYQ